MMQWITKEHCYIGNMNMEENTVPEIQFPNADIEMLTILLLYNNHSGTGEADWDGIFPMHTEYPLLRPTS